LLRRTLCRSSVPANVQIRCGFVGDFPQLRIAADHLAAEMTICLPVERAASSLEAVTHILSIHERPPQSSSFRKCREPCRQRLYQVIDGTDNGRRVTSAWSRADTYGLGLRSCVSENRHPANGCIDDSHAFRHVTFLENDTTALGAVGKRTAFDPAPACKFCASDQTGQPVA
jgi:hypothetical protein